MKRSAKPFVSRVYVQTQFQEKCKTARLIALSGHVQQVDVALVRHEWISTHAQHVLDHVEVAEE